mmetsp:Transcript_13459/g.31623  ORF Transcript_13459/g.31623 Transcript_13459/m.31623 type:complete len:577 (-) Transcript_13459:54-1784(-)
MVCLSQALRVCILLLVQANLCSGFVFPCRSSPGGCTNVFGKRRSINVCRTPPAGASFRERRSSFALMMKGEGDDEQGKMKKLRKLAADARSAMSQADDAAARAAALRGSGEESFPSDIAGEIRTRSMLRNVSQTLYGSWLRVFVRTENVGDPLGLGTYDAPIAEGKRRKVIEEAFKRLDKDGSGYLDRTELAAGIRVALGKDPDPEMLERVWREADVNKDGVIATDEFSEAMTVLLEDREYEGLVKEAQRRQLQPRRPEDQVLASLGEVELLNGGADATKALDRLRERGEISLWNSAVVTYENVTTDRLVAVTNLTAPDDQLGLKPGKLMYIRHVVIRRAAFVGFVCLCVSGSVFPLMLKKAMALFGVVALALHLATLVFANSIDGYLQYRPVRKDKDGEDRWARRQVGRLLGAYLCGIPVQALAKANGGLREVTVYGRREGAWNYRELQDSIARDGFLSAGLSMDQVYRQCVVQMMGLVAEYLKYGKATEGYRHMALLERNLAFVQKPLSRGHRQMLARLGLVVAYRLLLEHQNAFEEMVERFKRKEKLPEIIAALESAPPTPRGMIAGANAVRK